jgi:hypothetical protein
LSLLRGEKGNEKVEVKVPRILGYIEQERGQVIL